MFYDTSNVCEMLQAHLLKSNGTEIVDCTYELKAKPGNRTLCNNQIDLVRKHM